MAMEKWPQASKGSAVRQTLALRFVICGWLPGSDVGFSKALSFPESVLCVLSGSVMSDSLWPL